jgi:hypothetical protein
MKFWVTRDRYLRFPSDDVYIWCTEATEENRPVDKMNGEDGCRDWAWHNAQHCEPWVPQFCHAGFSEIFGRVDPEKPILIEVTRLEEL